MGPGVPPEALAGALESGGPTAGAAPPMPAGGAPGAPPATPPGAMDDAQAVAVMKKHNIGPDDLPIIAAAAGHIMQKMGGAGAPAPAGGPPPMPPGPPMGPPGVA